MNNKILGADIDFLESAKGLWTAKEICQQPTTLRATFELIKQIDGAINAFIEPLMAKGDIRIIFTGAGTSSFIGDSVAPYMNSKLGRKFESIATTDIVSAPNLFIDNKKPILLVSFGRSGNSPESVASVRICNQLCDEVYHLIITCNIDGELAKCVSADNSLVVNLPPETHDNGFAMTSSYSAMTLAAILCFEGIGAFANRIETICESVQNIIDHQVEKIANLVKEDIKRVAFLGSGVLQGVAHEAALKVMELSNGQIATNFDTFLGFRHGPKTFINSQTLVMCMIANNQYIRDYDMDLLQEIMRDGEVKKIFALSAKGDIPLASSDKIEILAGDFADEIDLLFPMIAIAQIFAFLQSLKLKITPDNPNPSGAVNRVVQGVKIHELNNG